MRLYTLAVGGLGLATMWRAGLVLADCRHICRLNARCRAYRPGMAWTASVQLGIRRRWALTGLGAGAVLLVLSPRLAEAPSDAILRTLTASVACALIVAWIARDRRLHTARYTSVCLAVTAFAALLYEAAGIVDWRSTTGGAPASSGMVAVRISGGFASVCASQMYLVAAIRKLKSSHFMRGAVLAESIAYGATRAASGSREFLPWPRPRSLPGLLRSKAFAGWCRLAAMCTVAAELTLGLGAAGLLPAAFLLGLGVPVHLGFALLSPLRIAPFTLGSLSLLVLATMHPLLAAPW